MVVIKNSSKTLTKRHSHNHIIIPQQTERTRNRLERPNTHRLARSRIGDTEVGTRRVERMNGVCVSTDIQGDVQLLFTGDGPPFVGAVVFGALDAAVDGVGDGARDLAGWVDKRMECQG
jgi:hypothetical protein